MSEGICNQENNCTKNRAVNDMRELKKNSMKNEIKILLTAIMFYTRIPVPKIKGYTSDMFSQSIRYFPLMGLLIGVLTAGVFYGFQLILPINIAILLSMAFSVYLTGAFHEDGLADFCDGFGGGYTKEKVLLIMKDSRIGTYGSVGLIFALAIKFASLQSIPVSMLVGAIIAGHTLSRVIPLWLVYSAKYVQDEATSKSSAIGKKHSTWGFMVAMLFGLIPLAWLDYKVVLAFLVLAIPVFVIFRRYVIKKVGGYSGDVLGALQQIMELVFYLSFLIFINNQT
jgi:adenosylcobinamide-GDP ribazoletransferase